MLNQFFPSLITFLLTIITLCSPLKEKSFPKRLQDQTNVTVQSQLNFPTSENLRNHLHNIPGQPVTIIKPYIPSVEFPNPITLISQHFHNERNPPGNSSPEITFHRVGSNRAWIYPGFLALKRKSVSITRENLES